MTETEGKTDSSAAWARDCAAQSSNHAELRHQSDRHQSEKLKKRHL